MNKIQKKRLIFILISASALVAAIACGGIAPRVSIALYIASYLIVGAAVLKSAVMDLFHPAVFVHLIDALPQHL